MSICVGGSVIGWKRLTMAVWVTRKGVKDVFSDSNNFITNNGMFCITVPYNLETHYYSTSSDLPPQLPLFFRHYIPLAPLWQPCLSLGGLVNVGVRLLHRCEDRARRRQGARCAPLHPGGEGLLLQELICRLRRRKGREEGGGRKRLLLKEVVKDYEVGVEALAAVVGYLYSGRISLCGVYMRWDKMQNLACRLDLCPQNLIGSQIGSSLPKEILINWTK